jgi:RNA polymerase primary sigma factor
MLFLDLIQEGNHGQKRPWKNSITQRATSSRHTHVVVRQAITRANADRQTNRIRSYGREDQYGHAHFAPAAQSSHDPTPEEIADDMVMPVEKVGRS